MQQLASFCRNTTVSCKISGYTSLSLDLPNLKNLWGTQLKEQTMNIHVYVAIVTTGIPTMTSEKQLQANRTNAKKSTGPKTGVGKARSRLNSRKHGLTAKMLIISGEDADDFDELRTELMEQHDPQTAMEAELVERLAGILWRLRRVPLFEAAILGARHAEVSKKEWPSTGSWEPAEAAEGEDEDEADRRASITLAAPLSKMRPGAMPSGSLGATRPLS